MMGEKSLLGFRRTTLKWKVYQSVYLINAGLELENKTQNRQRLDTLNGTNRRG